MSTTGSVKTAGFSDKVKDFVDPQDEGRGAALMREIKLSQGLDWTKTSVIEGDVNGKPYQLEDFAAAIDGRVDVKEVTAIVSTNRNNIVLVSFKTEAALNKAASHQGISVKGLQGNIYVANPTRVMWITLSGVPHQVPNSAVADVLKFYGRVVVTRSVFMTGRFQHIMTGARKVLLEVKAGTSPEDIPYELQIKGHSVILNIAGRRLRCLKCGEFGHKRKDCSTPRCTRCTKFGHLAEGCTVTITATKTYASAVESFPALQERQNPPPALLALESTVLEPTPVIAAEDVISTETPATETETSIDMPPSEESVTVDSTPTPPVSEDLPVHQVEKKSWAEIMDSESPPESDDTSSDTVALEDRRKMRAVEILTPKPVRQVTTKTTPAKSTRPPRKIIKKRATTADVCCVPTVVLTDAGFAAAVHAAARMDTGTDESPPLPQ